MAQELLGRVAELRGTGALCSAVAGAAHLPEPGGVVVRVPSGPEQPLGPGGKLDMQEIRSRASETIGNQMEIAWLQGVKGKQKASK